MANLPAPIAEFLQGRRFAVVGVSRKGESAANPIYRRLRDSGYEVLPVNPKATEVEGVKCYPALASIPGPLDGVVIATPPAVAAEIVRQTAARGVKQVWFHRSLGQGSVSPEALDECRRLGLTSIVGGCPLMYCQPVDIAHRCLRGWLNWRGQLPR